MDGCVDGPPEGILSRFNDMFKEKEEATHLRAAEVMRELGWDCYRAFHSANDAVVSGSATEQTMH